MIEGIEQALNKDDMMVTAYRCHGHAILRGGSPYSGRILFWLFYRFINKK